MARQQCDGVVVEFAEQRWLIRHGQVGAELVFQAATLHVDTMGHNGLNLRLCQYPRRDSDFRTRKTKTQ